MSRASALSMLGGSPAATAPAVTNPDPAAAVPPVVSPGAPAVADPAAPAAGDLQSSRLAIFAKKETTLVKEREALKLEREAFAREKAEADQYRTRGKEFDELMTKDRIAALKKLGFTETDLFNFAAQAEQKEATPEEVARKVAQEEAQKVRDELAKEKTDAEVARNEQLVSNFKTDISSHIKKHAEKYEFCAFEGADAETQAYEIIVENLKVNNELLSIDEALEIAEGYYEERANAMSQLKKRQPKPADPAADAVAAPAAAKAPISNVPQPQAKPKTLTNSVSATAAASTIPRRETPAEKKQRLIDALKRGGV